MNEITPGLVVARYGEIALKGQNQRRFVDQLRNNMLSCLREHNLEATVKKVDRRLYVQSSTPEAAAQALTKVFGLTSVSPAVRVPAEISAIQTAGLQEILADGLTKEHSFRVQSRRAYKGFPLNSVEINREVGGFIQDAVGSRTDLSAAADHTLGVEIHEDHALLYGRVIQGPGGLPVPLSGKVVVLLSAGLDSPVAAWMMMKRGCGIIPLHFSQGPASEERFLALCAVLQQWSPGYKIKPIILSQEEYFGSVYNRLKENRYERWACLFCKRAMLHTAENVARKQRAQAIALGDSLGQVASQTLRNMRAISDGITMPILRPLIGMDKVEIIALARQIGTHDISILEQTPCRYLPSHPITEATFEKFSAVRAVAEYEDQFPLAAD